MGVLIRHCVRTLSRNSHTVEKLENLNPSISQTRLLALDSLYGGFPVLEEPFLGVPIIRITVFGVYIGVPLFWESTI